MFEAILILALFLSTSASAWVKYEITNHKNGNTFSAEFEKKSKGKKWKNKQIAKNSWGKPDRDKEFLVGEAIDPGYTSCVDVMELLEDNTEIKIADKCSYDADYTIVEIDTTQEKEDAAAAKAERQADIQAIKAMKSDINASDLPGWRKKILRRLIKELKD